MTRDRIPSRIVVDPPDSADRMRRVESELFSKRPLWTNTVEPPSPWYARLFGRELKLAGAFAAAMCATAVVTWQLAQPTASLTESSAEVVVVPDGEIRQVELDQGVVQVRGGSTVQVNDDREGAIQLDLRQGVVSCQLTLKDWRSRFFVAAGEIQVTAVRDRDAHPSFTVKRTDSVKVVVEHGTVVVTSGDVQTYVSAGQEWNSGQVRVSSAQVEGSGPG